jgi:cell division septation protein DedD
MASQDTEITLGMGKLLGIFFVLAALCAVFLGVGYSLGKNSVKGATATVADATQPAGDGVAKPTGGSSAKPAPAADAAKPDMTFYKAVEQKEPDSKLSPAEEEPPAHAVADPMKPKAVSPEMARTGSGYVVQVAAVSKQEDAQSLADVLRKKNYAVLISTNPPNDKLYHVQVGPFSDIAEAETMRSRLLGEGYNPILKK